MRRGLVLLFTVATALSAAGCYFPGLNYPVRYAGNVPLRIINQMPYPVYMVKISPSNSNQWGEDWLGAATIAPLLLEMERLADALAEGEIEDMGLDAAATSDALAAIIGRIRRGG